MIVDASDVAVFLQRFKRRRARPDDPDDGVAIGLTRDGRAVRWPAPDRRRAGHVAVFAGSGAGKTVLVAHALASEVQAVPRLPKPARPALFVLDPKGDLEEGLLEALSALCPASLASVRYLDPFDGRGFPFDLRCLRLGKTPVEVRALQLASMVGAVSTSMGEQAHLGIGARQLDVLHHVHLAILASPHPEANLGWACDALTIRRGLARLASVTDSPEARQFLMNTPMTDELRASCASRLRSVYALTGGMRSMTCGRSCVQFDELLAPASIVILAVGRPPAGLSFFQQFAARSFATFLCDFLFERVSPWTGHHVRVVIDEAQVVAEALADRAERLYSEGRSRGVSLTTITQGTALLRDASPTLLDVLLANCPTKLIGRLNAPDAQLLARGQTTRRGIDERLSEVREKFIAEVTNLPDREFLRLEPGEAVRFTSRPVDLDAWKRAAEEHRDEIEKVKSRMSLAPGPPRMTLEEAVPLLERERVRVRGGGKRRPANRAVVPRGAPARTPGYAAAPAGCTRWG